MVSQYTYWKLSQGLRAAYTYAEIDIEMRVQCLERHVCAKTAILPLCAEAVRFQLSGRAVLFHEDDWVENAWNGS